jgi:D-amino peptidase
MSGPAVFISVDMEGVAGVARLNNTAPGHSTFPRGQVLMTHEANAAVAGAYDAGAGRVVVADSHGAMDNILPELLDARATLVAGSPRTCGMVCGLTEEFDAAFFLGYHAAAGLPGVLAHTFTGHWTELRINGESQSEADVNALLAGELGVPVKLLTGDDQTCATGIRGVPGVHTVAVKEYLSYNSAHALSPTAARESIRAGAAAAVMDDSVPAVRVPERLQVEIDLKAPTAAELVAAVPTVERMTEYTLRVDCTSVTGVYNFVAVAGALAAHAASAQVRSEP